MSSTAYRTWSTRTILICLLVAASSSFADDTRRMIADVEVESREQAVSLAHLPASAPNPILYYLRGAHTWSCGLVRTGERSITPILETEDENDFPYCQAVTAAATFRFRHADGYVFRFEQRDTREDTSTDDFFVLNTPAGLVPLDALNDEDDMPRKRSIDYLAAWGKARLETSSEATGAFHAMTAHSIVTDHSFLDVSEDESSHRCRALLDTVESDSAPAAFTTSCSSILASTVWTAGTTTYYILLMRDGAGRVHGQIFAVSGAGVSEDAALEQRLAADIERGQVLRVRAALRKLVDAH